jgi:hypothetical protein
MPILTRNQNVPRVMSEDKFSYTDLAQITMLCTTIDWSLDSFPELPYNTPKVALKHDALFHIVLFHVPNFNQW